MLIIKFISLPIFLLVGALWAILITFYLTIVFTGMWSLGIPITIREGGEVTGYIRWFKFIPKVQQ